MKKLVIIALLAMGLYVVSCTHDREENEIYEWGIDNGETKNDDI